MESKIRIENQEELGSAIEKKFGALVVGAAEAEILLVPAESDSPRFTGVSNGGRIAASVIGNEYPDCPARDVGLSEERIETRPDGAARIEGHDVNEDARKIAGIHAIPSRFLRA